MRQGTEEREFEYLVGPVGSTAPWSSPTCARRRTRYRGSVRTDILHSRRHLAPILVVLSFAACKRSDVPTSAQATPAPRRGAPPPARAAPTTQAQAPGGVVRAVAIDSSPPSIPENLRKEAIPLIVIQAVVEPDGSVSEVHAIKPAPIPPASRECVGYFERAVARWRYKPAEYHGKPVRSYLTLPFAHPPC